MVFEDPKQYLLLQTTLGKVALSDRLTIEDFVSRVSLKETISKVKITELGGVLNAVYLLTFLGHGREQRVVVKKFKE